MRLYDAKANTRVRLDFLLQVFGKLFVALRRDHRQRIDFETAQAFASLIHARAQPSANGLPPLTLRSNVTERANLEDVGVVPALTQRRVGENELERGFRAEEFLFLLHDQVVGAFCVGTIGLVVLRGIRPAAPLVDREIAVVNFVSGNGEIHLLKQRAVIGMIGKPPIFFLEHSGIISLDGMAFVVVPAVSVDSIDEEKAEHLDALWAQALLLVQVLPDGPADHFALNGAGIHVAPGFSQAEVVLAAGYAEFNKLVTPRDANLADAAVTVDSASRCLFEVVAVLNVLYLASDSTGRFDVKFNLGADGPPAGCSLRSGGRMVCCGHPPPSLRPPRFASPACARRRRRRRADRPCGACPRG